MSIVASLTGLVVMLIRKIRFIPHRVSVFLWVIPFIRMCFPFGMNSPYSLMTLISRLTTRTVTVWQASQDVSFSVTNSIMAADSYYPITYKVNILEKIFEVAGFIWIVVALAILIALLLLYISTIRAVREPKSGKDGVFFSDKVDGPAVYGIIRPRIILPSSLEASDIRYIFAHERTHIRRGDNLWRLLGFLAAAVHWFNPLSWVFLKVFLGDLELACDEQAVAGFSEDERKGYAKALLECVSGRNVFVSAFGGAKVRTRIENLLSYKRMTVFSAVGFIALVLAIIYTLLTNAG
ncbi:MAG: peptidase M56 BlaR1 [Clostridiales bacterium]|nr:peptidase M56 BlaR1 [Clostridiales bacterium]